MVFHNIYFKSTFVAKGLRRVDLFINIDDGEYFCKLETMFKHDSSMCQTPAQEQSAAVIKDKKQLKYCPSAEIQKRN